MSKFVCVKNVYSGMKETRLVMFKKGNVYDIEEGRFMNYAMSEDKTRLPIIPDVLDIHFITLQQHQDLKQVEYVINELGSLVDDLENDLISAKEFKELFLAHKSQEICRALVIARKYLKE